jgi:uncharacterized protein
MFTILLHSSKTMRTTHHGGDVYRQPLLLSRTEELAGYLKKMNLKQIQTAMQISPAMATRTKQLIEEWSMEPEAQSPAIDTFLGDIYSGLQVRTFDDADRVYAQDTLFILSGLYGVVRALDSIMPYRLEMAYKLPMEQAKNLYSYWGDTIARALPENRTIINVSSVEYTKAVFPYLKTAKIITPKFMTRDATSGEPKFVTVHAKVARGAFAHWLIKNRVESIDELRNFDELNYYYDPLLSTVDEPVFVCDEFGGLGLSVRITKKNK